MPKLYSTVNNNYGYDCIIVHNYRLYVVTYAFVMIKLTSITSGQHRLAIYGIYGCDHKYDQRTH